jgi:aminoglycoside phosphotransferase (APT) family kinase protein
MTDRAPLDSLDARALAPYLEQHVAGFKGPFQAEKFAGGQSNPTFKLTARSGVYVLRRQPPGALLKSAHAVDREYRVTRALADTGVPVARVFHLCEDPAVIGSLFYVMEYCDGNVYWGAALPEARDGQQRAAMYDEMNRVLAALHQVDVEAVGLADFGRPSHYFDRQWQRWSAQYAASALAPVAAMDELMAQLPRFMPPDDGKVALVHGDYRLDNLMFSHDNSRIIAVLDWELSTLGHPYADLAYQCMQMRLPHSSDRTSMSGLLGLDRRSLGIPSEADYVARYCQRMGIAHIDHWQFYLAFSFFRLAAIAQGVAKRASQGNASNQRAAAAGAMVAPLAQAALACLNE